MENEGELSKDKTKHTDDGYSEKKTDLSVDRNKKSHHSTQGGQIFTPQKKPKTVFQAQKDEKK